MFQCFTQHRKRWAKQLVSRIPKKSDAPPAVGNSLGQFFGSKVINCVPLWPFLQAHCHESISFHKRDVHCLEDTKVTKYLSYPSGGAPFLRCFVPWQLRRFDCGDLLARGCMPAHKQWELFLPTGRALH